MVFRTLLRLTGQPRAPRRSRPGRLPPPLRRPASFRGEALITTYSTASLSTSPRRVEAPPPRRPHHISLSDDTLRLGRPLPTPTATQSTNRRARVSAGSEEHLQQLSQVERTISSSIIRKSAARTDCLRAQHAHRNHTALICTAAAKSYAKPFSSVKPPERRATCTNH